MPAAADNALNSAPPALTPRATSKEALAAMAKVLANVTAVGPKADLPATADYYLIHQIGKVASQTIEGVLREATPRSWIERHHFLSDKGLDYLDAMCQLPGVDTNQIGGISHQLRLATAVRAEIASSAFDNIWVLCGVRDPLTLTVSAFFQNLDLYCPWVDYDPANLEVETARLLEFFTFAFERMLSGRPISTYIEALLHLKLRGPERWFEQEFNEFYGVDIYQHPFGDAPFIQFQHDRFKFCIYRSETLPTALPALLTAMGLPAMATKDRNVGASKPYAALYHAFRKKFKPSRSMMSYYYDNRFYRHFYSPTDAYAASA